MWVRNASVSDPHRLDTNVDVRLCFSEDPSYIGCRHRLTVCLFCMLLDKANHLVQVLRSNEEVAVLVSCRFTVYFVYHLPAPAAIELAATTHWRARMVYVIGEISHPVRRLIARWSGSYEYICVTRDEGHEKSL